jgi:hypothetical protein
VPKEPGADAKFKIQSAVGVLDVKGIGKACDTLRAEAQALADKALADRATEKFVKNCKADEVEVARREGVPKNIIRIGPGRVFMYEVQVGKKKEMRRYAFDGQGKRIDEKILTATSNVKPEYFELREGEELPIPELEAPK